VTTGAEMPILNGTRSSACVAGKAAKTNAKLSQPGRMHRNLKSRMTASRAQPQLFLSSLSSLPSLIRQFMMPRRCMMMHGQTRA
jgi:hypothetical protein